MGGPDGLISPHEAYVRMTQDTARRLACYREWVSHSISGDELETIRFHLQRQRALGSGRFLEQIERILQRRAGARKT